jgi:hypothetical protein
MGYLTIISEKIKKPVKFEDSVIYIRPVGVVKHQEFVKQATKRERSRDGWVETRDNDLLFQLVIDYMIVDWENVKDPVTGENVPCTKENKLMLPDTVLSDLMNQASVPGFTHTNGHQPGFQDELKNSFTS